MEALKLNDSTLAKRPGFLKRQFSDPPTNRQQKFQAPEQVRPNGRWKTVADLLSNFGSTRQTSIDYMKNMKEDMRAHFVSMPLGKLDAFQGYLFMIGHSERHLAQLKEVKADPKYPKN